MTGAATGTLTWSNDGSRKYQINVKGTTNLPVVSIVPKSGGSTVTEGSPAVFTVSRTEETTEALTVLLDVAEAATGDMVASSSEGSRQVEIPIGSASADFSVATTGDADDEPHSSVTVGFRTDSAYRIDASAGEATVAIEDGDLPVVSIQIRSGGGSVPEGSPAVVTVSRAGDTTSTLTMLLSVSEAAGGDMVDPAQEGDKVVVIQAGDASADHSVATAGDSDDENDSSVTVGIRPDSAYRIDSSSNRTTVAIEDNDDPALPVISINPAAGGGAVTEGSPAAFTVSRTGDTASTLTVLLSVSETAAATWSTPRRRATRSWSFRQAKRPPTTP